MKTAEQHNAAETGTLKVFADAPSFLTPDGRRQSKEALEKQVAELTQERNALKSLVRDLRDGAEQRPIPSSLMEAVAEVRAEHAKECASENRKVMVASGAILLPGGTRIVLRHVETYAPGGDEGIAFEMGGGSKVQWTAPAASAIPGAAARRHDQQLEAMASLDRLFAVRE